MNEQEKIAENIIRQAFDNGGEVLFTNTEIEKCENRKLLKSISLILSMYGKIYGKMTSYRWTHYQINENGYRFIKQGGFKGEEERKNRAHEIESLTLENARLQKESAEYQKKIRHKESIIRTQHYIEAVLFLVSMVLAFIHFCLKINP